MSQYQQQKNPYIDPSVMTPNYMNPNTMNNYYQANYAQYRPNNIGYAQNGYHTGYVQAYQSANSISYAQDIYIDPKNINPYNPLNMVSYNNTPYNNNTTNNNNNIYNNNNTNNLDKFIDNIQRACKDGDSCSYNKNGKCIWFHKSKNLIYCFNGPNCNIKATANKFGTICEYNHTQFNSANKDPSIKLGTETDLTSSNISSQNTLQTTKLKYSKKGTQCMKKEKCSFNLSGRCIWGHSNKKDIFCFNGPACINKDTPNKYGNKCEYNHKKFNNSRSLMESKDDSKDSIDDNHTSNIYNNTTKKSDIEPKIQNNVECKNGETCEFNKRGECKFKHDDKYKIKCANGTNCKHKNINKVDPKKQNCLYNHE